MVNDGGNEYFCLIPPNDKGASLGNVSIYICTGKNENTHVRVYKSGTNDAIYDRTIAEAYGVTALVGLPGNIKGEYVVILDD